ncbi:hypothetical protein [Halosolutus gelatinilyticus]|uniref:hypothetical protein n=1 Tax=Halosolutus gelatinilyticus TaxID=2931975 RepID=UPI001FF1D599|nr:hypothetical protein [Halosolutus gelatinilyticus]
MAGKSASLLTKTQRNRIRDDFADLDEEKKRRDQQRIRERVRSGLLDFQLLADYPDRQFEMALDELSDDELLTILASTTIVVGRLRELNDIDRAELIKEVRAQIEDDSDTTNAATIDQIELQTTAEIRSQAEADVEERFEEGPWDKRASRLGKLAIVFFIPYAILELSDEYIAEGAAINLDPLLPLFGIPFVICTVGWFIITSLKILKYNIIPVLVRFRRNPAAVVREGFKSLIRDPGKQMRKAWDDL